MAITLNAKGTSNPSFKVGKTGPTIHQDGFFEPPPNTDFVVALDEDKFLVVDSGSSSPALITTTNLQDLHINPAIGGGQFLLLNNIRWPVADGLSGQVLRTDGTGVISFTHANPKIKEFVATELQTVFNTSPVKTAAKSNNDSYIQVFVDGLLQLEGISRSYTVTGPNEITFNTGLPLDADVVVFSFLS